LENSRKPWPVWLKRTIATIIIVGFVISALYGFISWIESGQIFHDSFKIHEIIPDPKDSNIVYLQVTDYAGLPTTLICIDNCRGVAYQSDPGLIEQIKTLEIGKYYRMSIYEDHFRDRLTVLYIRPLD